MYDQMQSELYRAWDSVQLSTIMYESDDPYGPMSFLALTIYLISYNNQLYWTAQDKVK